MRITAQHLLQVIKAQHESILRCDDPVAILAPRVFTPNELLTRTASNLDVGSELWIRRLSMLLIVFLAIYGFQAKKKLSRSS